MLIFLLIKDKTLDLICLSVNLRLILEIGQDNTKKKGMERMLTLKSDIEAQMLVKSFET